MGDDLRDQPASLEDQLKEMKGDIKELKHDTKRLTARQTEMELHRISIAEKLLKGCGKNQ